MKTVMGLDPGAATGVALYRDGILRVLKTIKPAEFGEVLTWLAPELVIFEDSRLQRHVWAATGLSRAAALKVGRNVGMVDQLCAEIEATCRRPGVQCIGVSPLRKGAKIDAARFAAITGWIGRTNAHVRDAAMVAFPYRAAS